ncbi:hypothetical protein HWV62_11830 [Athelia sp. TMB]|nr:hypothetical protein HWV62_11830 [Athelia sp. TMB]
MSHLMTWILLLLPALYWTVLVSAAPAASITTVTTNPGAKIGLAWANGDDPSLVHFKTAKVSLLYTWSPSFPSNAKALGFHPVPMLWGKNQVSSFKKLVVKGYSDTVLGFNEPNESGQSNLTAAQGASLWKEYIQPLKNEGYTLISPATSSNPNGMVWMKAFIKACGSTCTVSCAERILIAVLIESFQFDGFATHYYDVTSSGLIDYINLWHKTFGKPIWLTEFACQVCPTSHMHS